MGGKKCDGIIRIFIPKLLNQIENIQVETNLALTDAFQLNTISVKNIQYYTLYIKICNMTCKSTSTNYSNKKNEEKHIRYIPKPKLMVVERAEQKGRQPEISHKTTILTQSEPCDLDLVRAFSPRRLCTTTCTIFCVRILVRRASSRRSSELKCRPDILPPPLHHNNSHPVTHR